MLYKLVFTAADLLQIEATDTNCELIASHLDTAVYTVYTALQAAGLDQQTADLVINTLF